MDGGGPRLSPRHAHRPALCRDALSIGRLLCRDGDYAYAKHWYKVAIAAGAPPADASLFIDTDKYRDYPQSGVRICDEKLAALPKLDRG